MARRESISAILDAISGRSYGAYRELLGAREVVDGVEVSIVRVQPDPYAPPSVARLEAAHRLSKLASYPIPVADWVYRKLYRELRRSARRLGEGYSGFLGVPRPSNAMLARSAVEVTRSRLVVRLWVGLPSRHRRVLGREARYLLLGVLPRLLAKLSDRLRDDNLELQRHVEAWIEQEHIRQILPELNAVAFVADGSILPRRCGTCEEPLENAVPFKSPPSLRAEIDLPTGRRVSGLLVRSGLTLIVGSAFHGKTTLAEAIALGIYDHVPGDGRELVVSVRDTVVVRAEDGRSVSCVDLETFIHNLPGGGDTSCFTTLDASGATSTAAAIQEAVELGVKLLVIDEDYVASNMLYIDPVAVKLVDKMSISPLASKARSMKEQGISLLVVSQGHEPLLAVADTVIAMEDYLPRDTTELARKLAAHFHVERYTRPKPRRLVSCPRLGRPRLRGYMLEARGLARPVPIHNPQLVEEAQYTTLLALLHRLGEFEGLELREVQRRVDQLLSHGFSAIVGGEPGPNLAWVRGIDFIYLLNRLPGCRFTH
jgi:predicted ABC-class ATPase